jgi:hypothetical protein
MTLQTYARIRWFTQDEGGFSFINSDVLHYVYPVFFHDPAFETEFWSFVMDFLEPPSTTQYSIAEVRFLFSEAPIEVLYPGSTFNITIGASEEGGLTKVAHGEVLGNSLEAIIDTM